MSETNSHSLSSEKCVTAQSHSINLEKLKKRFKNIRFIIAVGSGKGGVGKTTLSSLLATGLKISGYSTGIFDLDFYGPNIHLFIENKQNLKPNLTGDGKIRPFNENSIKLISLGLLISEKEPIFMRGLLAGKLLLEFIEKTDWPPLDFLILDLPPGTGDIFLNMLEVFPLEGFILVTTAHNLAVADALKTLLILKEKNIPIFGIVENMADFFENKESLNKLLTEQKLKLLYQIPLLKSMAKINSLKDFERLGELRKTAEELAEKVLDLVFRIK